MDSNLERELFKAAVLVFEKLAFMFPTQEIEKHQQNARVEAVMSVEFCGLFSGHMVVKICGDILPSIAANMLGEEDPPSERRQRDALGEIANVICGNMLPEIAKPKEGVFHIGAPQIIEITDSPGGDTDSPVAEVQIGLDQGRADLLLFVSNNDDESYLKE